MGVGCETHPHLKVLHRRPQAAKSGADATATVVATDRGTRRTQLNRS